jgi:hypothetical protein
MGHKWSETTIMEVIGLLYVSVGASIVHLHDSVGSRYVFTCKI